MHILFQFDSAPHGGQEAQFAGLLESLVRAGHQGSVVLGEGDLSERVCTLVEQRASVVAVRRDMSASEAIDAAAAVARVAADCDADLLCLTYGISILVGSLAAHQAQRPYVAVVNQALDDFHGSLQVLVEQSLARAQRVYCASAAVARSVLSAAPTATCRAWPAEQHEPTADAFATVVADLAEVPDHGQDSVSSARLRGFLSRNPELALDSPQMLRVLVRALDDEATIASQRAAELEQERGYQARQIEALRSRQHQHIEDTGRELAATRADLARHRAENEQLQLQMAEREERLVIAGINAAEYERELTEIKGSTGWVLLRLLWQLRTHLLPHGSGRDKFVWAALCTLRAARNGGPGSILTGLLRTWLRTPYGSRFFDSLPQPVADWLDKRIRSSATAVANRTNQRSGTDLLRSWGENPVLTVSAHPRANTYDVIVFPIIDWNFRFQRPQQLASRFAEAGHRVFYIAATFCDGNVPIIRPLRQGVVEVQLPGPPGTSAYADDIDGIVDSLVDVLAQLRAQFNIGDAVCIANLPYWTTLVLRLRQQYGWRVVYDCLDDYSGFSNTTRRMLRAEETLTRQSDLVLVTSRHLLEKQSPLNSNCALIPNASDFQHFRFGASTPPAELTGLRSGAPIIGYYGAIADWFDSQLVGALAKARPEWEFVLIGSTFGCDLRPLRSRSNVHLLGEKPYAEIPAYLHAFDVGIIPFKKLPLTEATNPVKLFEYASAGKRIVATDLAELRHYTDYLRLATGEASWLAALDQALTPVEPAEAQRQVDFGRRNSWEHRLQQIKDLTGPMYPLASIIIVTYNNIDYTRLCLESIVRKTAYPNFELVIVDNASTDGTPEFLREFATKHDKVKLVLNDTNHGFAKGNNIGLEVASGDYIVYLNNDTVVPSAWLSRLLYYLRDERVGMVGPVTNSSGNESRISVDYNSINEMDAFAEAYTRRHDGSTFEIHMLALFCAALRRSVVQEVGELDERFGIGMFEDDDYAMRVRARGYSIVCAEDVFVHHWGGASFSRLDRADYQKLFAENKAKFETKWGMDWTPHRYRSNTVLSQSS